MTGKLMHGHADIGFGWCIAFTGNCQVFRSSTC